MKLTCLGTIPQGDKSGDLLFTEFFKPRHLGKLSHYINIQIKTLSKCIVMISTGNSCCNLLHLAVNSDVIL